MVKTYSTTAQGSRADWIKSLTDSSFLMGEYEIVKEIIKGNFGPLCEAEYSNKALLRRMGSKDPHWSQRRIMWNLPDGAYSVSAEERTSVSMYQQSPSVWLDIRFTPTEGGVFIVKDRFSGSDLCLRDIPTTYKRTDLTECDAQFVPKAVHKRNLKLQKEHDRLSREE